jgi:hypothetical protein
VRVPLHHPVRRDPAQDEDARDRVRSSGGAQARLRHLRKDLQGLASMAVCNRRKKIQRQCDQFGRIFAQWVMFIFGQYRKITYRSISYFLAACFYG